MTDKVMEGKKRKEYVLTSRRERVRDLYDGSTARHEAKHDASYTGGAVYQRSMTSRPLQRATK